MLHRPISRALFAGALFSLLLTLPGPAPADTFYETVYLPTSSVVSVPTSSVLATSYVVPTSYTSTFIPTSTIYTSDSVLIPTSTTYYRRPSIFRPRRFVERTTYSLTPTTYLSSTSALLPTSYFIPTSYVVPTTYLSSSIIPTSYVIDNGVVTTSASYPCDTTSTVAPVRSTASNNSGGNGSGAIISEPMNGRSSNERRPSATLNSSPTGDGSFSSDVSPPVPMPPATPSAPKPAGTPASGTPASGTPASGPLDQPGPIDPDKVQVPVPGASGTQPPNETQYRNARRPNYDVRNILRGRVISAESKLPEEGISVIVSSVTKTYSDRQAMTDADGEFKISLPDGDWTVKVKMPSGSIFTVGQDFLTASSGKITNSSGRYVAEFLIKR